MISADTLSQIRTQLVGLANWDRALIAATLLCGVSVMVCLYVVTSVPTHHHNVAVSRLFDFLKQEHLNNLTAEETTEIVHFATATDVFKRLQAIATRNGVTIESAASNGEEPTDVRVSLFGDFAAINRFVHSTEALDLTLENFSLALADPSGRSARIDAHLDLARPGDTRATPPKQIIWSLGNLKEMSGNDPFARDKRGAKRMAGDELRDLTWAYRLSGLSKISGVYFATIDNQDFSIGETVDNMTITKIDNSGVFLTAEQGEPCVIRFREPQLTQHSSL